MSVMTRSRSRRSFNKPFRTMVFNARVQKTARAVEDKTRACIDSGWISIVIIVRIVKVTMVAALAAFALIVAYDNIVDYDSNYEFVRHVLSMDTTFGTSVLKYRAISNETMWHVAYALIIAVEGTTGLLLALGALALLRRLRSPAELFNRTKVWAVAGLGAGFGLWFVGFLVIAGEYFAMWQSKVWNGQEAAFRITTVILAVLIYVSLPDEDLS
jgi:predicted small integral membrane protein